MNELAKILDESTRRVDEALTRAREELVQVNQRKAELEAIIAQAEAFLRAQAPSLPEQSRGMTLHEAIAVILREGGNRWMSVREITAAVNNRGLYRKKDGSPVEMSQIHARTKNYAQVFEKEGSNIRLHDSAGESR